MRGEGTAQAAGQAQETGALSQVSATVIGVDVGGTKTAAGLVAVADDGSRSRIETSVTRPTPAREGRAAIVATIIELITRVRGDAASAGLPAPDFVGVGAAGVIDETCGVVIAATDHLSGWAGTALGAGLTEATGLPVKVVNDVHAHALGEFHHGAGKGMGSLLVLAAGTGLGGSFITAGVPVFGARHTGGHFGHVPAAAAAGLPCACGRSGHLESVASGPGLRTLYLREGGDPRLTPPGIVRAAPHDRAAAAAIDTSGTALGLAIAGWVNALDPEAVVVTGGLADDNPRWWAAMRRAFADQVLPSAQHCPLTAATRGAGAPLLGAASLRDLPGSVPSALGCPEGPDHTDTTDTTDSRGGTRPGPGVCR